MKLFVKLHENEQGIVTAALLVLIAIVLFTLLLGSSVMVMPPIP